MRESEQFTNTSVANNTHFHPHTLGGEGGAVVGCKFGIHYICHVNELMFTLIPAVTEALSATGRTVADECKVSDTLQEVSQATVVVTFQWW